MTEPKIEIWYGQRQKFGEIGTPQRFINVLGNVKNNDRVTSLTFSLNGGEESGLSLGQDNNRLARKGDFNIEIDISDLKQGENEVAIIARENDKMVDSTSVTVDYIAGRKWPLPYSIDWSKVENIQDVAQVVDGLWRIEDGGVRTVEPYYDRVIAIGDMTWTDYEAKAPITFYDYTREMQGPPCYGHVHASMGLRWTGHGDDGLQPRKQWNVLGAVLMFTLSADLKGWHWRMIAGKGGPRKVKSENYREIELGKPYWMKTRVETLPSGISRYSAKVWDYDLPEPEAWDDFIERADEPNPWGSLLLCPHNTDVKFGNVEIIPLPGSN